jgi:cytoskeletal protein CcmA (bactofilin family)
MFGRKQRTSGVIQTLVGDGTRIKGDVRFDGGCHIDGVVHGNVIADRDPEAFLSISSEGLVDGSVRVPTVMLNGKVQGDVYASVRVELGSSAKVFGNLHYELLEMAAGAEINGKLIHESVHEKTPAKQSNPYVAAEEGTQPITAAKTVKQSG